MVSRFGGISIDMNEITKCVADGKLLNKYIQKTYMIIHDIIKFYVLSLYNNKNLSNFPAVTLNYAHQTKPVLLEVLIDG